MALSLSMRGALVAAMTVVFVMAGAALLSAQQQQPAQDQPQASFEDETLAAFAAAASQISQIREVYTQRLENAENSDQANQLQREAQEKMVQAIRDEGIDVNTYNAVSQAMQQNGELRRKVQRLIQEQG